MYSTFHSCQCGSKPLKRAMLAHNHGAFATVNMKGQGVSSTRRHEKWGITKSGFATSQETAYPFALARTMAHAFARALVALKMTAPVDTFSELQANSSQVLQAIRGQIGLQPKAHKLPPIVNEYHTLIHVTNTRDHLPSSKLNFRLQKAVAVKCTSTDKTITIPAYSKLLSEQLKTDASTKGGVSQGIDGSEIVAVSQTWAIPWTPMQFVTEASKAGHPASLKSFVLAVLHEVTELYNKTKAHDRIKFRANQIQFWVDRCKSLAEEERKLHEQLPNHAKKLMQNKRFLLWQEMLEASQYVDMGVVSELRQGIHLKGETCRTTLWPEKFTPAAISPEELSDISRRDRSSVKNYPIISDDSTVNEAVWQQTMEEVADGFVEGPFELSTIPSG